MLVDFRPAGKLRGSKPVDVTAALGPVVDALAEDSVDLSRARVMCDWVQYRDGVREIIASLFARWDSLVERNALPDELYRVELGVGNGSRPRPGWTSSWRWTPTTARSGEMLRLLLASGADIRMHVNNGAVASFVDTIPLLHPYGRLICHDPPFWGRHYDFLFPAVLDAHVDQLIHEFARKGCEDLKVIHRSGWDRAIGLGVVDVKTEQVESVDTVAQRIHKALDTFPADELIINPNCGLRHPRADVTGQSWQRW